MPRKNVKRVVHSTWKNKGTVGHKKNRTKMDSAMNVENIQVSSTDKIYLNGTIYTGEANYSKNRKYTTGPQFSSKSLPLVSGVKIKNTKHKSRSVLMRNNSKNTTETQVSKKFDQLNRIKKRTRFKRGLK